MTLVELELIRERLSKKGVDYQEYAENMNEKTKKYPVYMLKVEGKDVFVHNEKELAKLTKGSEDAQYLELFENVRPFTLKTTVY